MEPDWFMYILLLLLFTLSRYYTMRDIPDILSDALTRTRRVGAYTHRLKRGYKY